MCGGGKDKQKGKIGIRTEMLHKTNVTLIVKTREMLLLYCIKELQVGGVYSVCVFPI